MRNRWIQINYDRTLKSDKILIDFIVDLNEVESTFVMVKNLGLKDIKIDGKLCKFKNAGVIKIQNRFFPPFDIITEKSVELAKKINGNVSLIIVKRTPGKYTQKLIYCSDPSMKNHTVKYKQFFNDYSVQGI